MLSRQTERRLRERLMKRGTNERREKKGQERFQAESVGGKAAVRMATEGEEQV
jgi:hypothetical protein